MAPGLHETSHLYGSTRTSLGSRGWETRCLLGDAGAKQRTEHCARAYPVCPGCDFILTCARNRRLRLGKSWGRRRKHTASSCCGGQSSIQQTLRVSSLAVWPPFQRVLAAGLSLDPPHTPPSCKVGWSRGATAAQPSCTRTPWLPSHSLP